MTGVFLAADVADKKMWKSLPGILSHSYSIGFYSKDMEIQTPQPELIICNLEDARSLQVDFAAVIFRKEGSVPPFLFNEERAVAIVDSGAEPRLLEYAGTTGLPAITCGLSVRDTLSLSSYTSDSAVISLQRTLPCFDGSIIEPQDIPVRLAGPSDQFLLLSAAAIYLLTGSVFRLKHAVFGL